MSEPRREVEELLRGLRPPLPPPELEPRALGAARAALVEETSDDRWSALLQSRGLRWAWALAVVALAVGHLLLPGAGGADTGARAFGGTTALPAADAELGEFVALPRIDAESRSLSGLLVAGEADAVDAAREAPGSESREGGES